MSSSPRFARYVALGDSFTEGVGDHDPARPNGVRGWADRVAEVLGAHDPGFAYANLAIRGRKLAPILDEQLEPALALGPDLVTVYAGANDIMRPSVDLETLPSRWESFFVFADLPHHKFSNEKTKRLLGWQPTNDLHSVRTKTR